jgi:hypothetical protein
MLAVRWLVGCMSIPLMYLRLPQSFLVTLSNSCVWVGCSRVVTDESSRYSRKGSTCTVLYEHFNAGCVKAAG